MAVLQEAAASPVRHADGEPGGWWRLGRGVLLPLGFAVLATVGWEILCRVVRISPLLLPPPCAVWMVLSQSYEILLQHALPTTIETVVSFGLASLLGVVLAVAITFSAWVREALYPSIVMFQLIPKIALAPLFIVWLGVGSRSGIVVAIFIAFFPVVVSTATGLVSAKPEVSRPTRSRLPTVTSHSIERSCSRSVAESRRNCSFSRSKSTGLLRNCAAPNSLARAASVIVPIGCDHHHRQVRAPLLDRPSNCRPSIPGMLMSERIAISPGLMLPDSVRALPRQSPRSASHRCPGVPHAESAV
jgi:hypothetical protein